MKNRFLTGAAAIACVLFVAAFPCSSLAAEAATEPQLIQILQSDRSPAEKDAACARLQRIGTVASVPALAALLTDEQLSHSARFALESMEFSEAAKALIDALDKTRGTTKAGIIGSLGVRREKSAVAPLGKLLTDPDANVAAAAASAMGRISGAEAMKLLQAQLGKSSGTVHDAIVDGALQCADRLIGTGGQDAALSVFERLYKTEKAERFQIAAYRGMILCSGAKGLKLVVGGLTAPPSPAQSAALQLAREVNAPDATKTLSSLLAQVSVPVQRGLIEALAQRGDPAAAEPIAPFVTAGTPEVRIAAINALGILGSNADVPLLAAAAAAAKGEEQASARQALVQLNRGDVTGALLRSLSAAQPGAQAEAARALGERREGSAVPKLFELARSDSASSRNAALSALAVLASQEQLPSLVGLVLAAKDDEARTRAAEALNSAIQNIRVKNGKVDAKPIVDAFGTASPDAKVALLSVCSGLADPQVRAAIRDANADPNPKVSAAAARALFDTVDGELLPDVLKHACAPLEDNLRTLAIAGVVRLTTQEDSVKLTNPQKLEMLKAILATQLKPEQKRLLLSGLAAVPESESLNLAQAQISDPAVKPEAARAVVRLAAAVPDSRAAASALKNVLSDNPSPDLRAEAEAALKQIGARAAFITSWQVAGPYLESGKDFAALFDIAFPPEKPGSADVKWQTLPVCRDPQKPYSMDLLEALGGEQRVAYARTAIHSDKEQQVVMDLGSDDGVKVWVNNKQVYANNTARPLQAGSDKALITLKAGWNTILLKVTQNNLGWEFCVRFLTPDGAPVEGLETDAKKAD